MSSAPISSDSATLDRPEFTQRVLIVVGIVTLVVVLILLVWAGAEVLLLIFGGVLLGVFLRGLSDLLSRFTPLPPIWSLAVVLVTIAAILTLAAWFMGSAIASQMDQMGRSIMQAWQQLQAQLQQYAWGRQLISDLPSLQTLGRSGGFSRVTGIFATSVGAIFSLIVILFTGLYIAFDPGLYRAGVIRLTPLHGRKRAGEVLDSLGRTLRGWLISQSFSMTVVGVATTVGLWLMGVPLALALGLIAFTFTFVPYVGPIAAAVPAVLVALTVSPMQAAYVALLYFGVQMVEGNLLTPLFQQQMVKLPPALTIVSQVLMGALLGTVGIVFATPLAACALVLVKMLYVHDTLGDVKQK